MSQRTRKDLNQSNPEDYFKSISTQEANVAVNISESDNISEGDEKWMLIQMGQAPFSCAYLSDEQALELQQAIAGFLATKKKVKPEDQQDQMPQESKSLGLVLGNQQGVELLQETPEDSIPYPRERYVKNAKATYENEDLEVDDNAKLSRVDESGNPLGCWVSAWVWVPDVDLEIEDQQ